MPEPKDVLDFWFEELTAEQRFKRDDAVDQRIRQCFGALLDEFSRGVPPQWRSDAHSLLAAVIVLDQFSRNLFRDDARAFAQDAAAMALTDEAIGKGWDEQLSSDERQFLYMPLMHSEELADVERCIALMQRAEHAEGEAFARRHAVVIARFGRYPARNETFGRETTPDEAEFLRLQPMGF